MAIDYFCYDGNPSENVAPHRPAVLDVGRSDFLDFPGAPVDGRYEWSAEHANQMCQVVPKLAEMGNVLAFEVRFNSGDPFIQASRQTRSSPATLTPADNGTGDVSITWPANNFPPSILAPKAYVVGATPGFATAEAIANGVRVRVRDAAGDAADLSFVVEVG